MPQAARLGAFLFNKLDLFGLGLMAMAGTACFAKNQP